MFPLTVLEGAVSSVVGGWDGASVVADGFCRVRCPSGNPGGGEARGSCIVGWSSALGAAADSSPVSAPWLLLRLLDAMVQ